VTERIQHQVWFIAGKTAGLDCFRLDMHPVVVREDLATNCIGGIVGHDTISMDSKDWLDNLYHLRVLGRGLKC
jgi:hypothetical protein